MDSSPNVVESIVVGVFSGVLTSIGIAFFLIFIRKVVIPWYQALTYSGINLSGNWYSVDPTMAQRIELSIKQRARNIKGSAVFTAIDDEHNPGGYEPTRTFVLNGISQDRFVGLMLKHTDNNRLGINCYLLEVIGDGCRMAGVFSFYSVSTNQIGESYHLLYRDPAEADRASREARRDLEERRRELMEELRENERQIESRDPEDSDDNSEAR